VNPVTGGCDSGASAFPAHLEVDILYQWLVFAHVVGVFGFLLAHGVSAAVVFRVRGEHDVATLRTLLNLSARSLMASYLSLLVLLAAGVGAAFLGHWWAFGWPWAALGVLIAIWLSMASLTGPALRRLRLAVGIDGPGRVIAQAKPEDVPAAVAAVRPWVSALTGGVGLLVILWLMMFKPF
jgi:hypothetical protein